VRVGAGAYFSRGIFLWQGLFVTENSHRTSQKLHENSGYLRIFTEDTYSNLGYIGCTERKTTTPPQELHMRYTKVFTPVSPIGYFFYRGTLNQLNIEIAEHTQDGLQFMHLWDEALESDDSKGRMVRHSTITDFTDITEEV
jgi:hypothetical protein